MIIKAQKTTEENTEAGEDILARFCYLYPSYTFIEAKKLPYNRVLKMIKVARKEQAYEWYNLLRIAMAPHGKKGSASNIIREYKKIIET